MTTVVYIYPARGSFRGGEYTWKSPLPGAKHDFLLFMRQDEDEAKQKEALAEISRYGFVDVRFIAQGRMINVEMLNRSELADFRQNYEAALKDGASLAWYP
jgi:hypothetical protein